MVEKYHLHPAWIGAKWFLFTWSENIFLSFKLFTTNRQEKLCLPNWSTILYMVIEEILTSTFVTEWISTSYCETSEFFFWLIFLVKSQPSLTTLRFRYSSSMNTNLGKSSEFPISSISTRFSSFSTIIIFSEWLSSSMKSCIFLKIKLEKYNKLMFLWLWRKNCNKSRSNKISGWLQQIVSWSCREEKIKCQSQSIISTKIRL